MEKVLHTKHGNVNVSIFNLIYDQKRQVNLVLDAEILHSSLIAFHPLYNGMSVFLKPEGVLKFLELRGRFRIAVFGKFKTKVIKKHYRDLIMDENILLDGIRMLFKNCIDTQVF